MSEKQIVALSIDKVQSFLTETIHAHVQEKQTEKATLQNIQKASQEISNDFYDIIREKFSGIDIEVLLSCSGVFIFSCTLSEVEIEEKLDQLFVEYYCSSQGQKLLRCVCFPAEGNDKIQSIQEAKKRLKQSKCLNKRIERSKNILFSFCAADGVKAEAEKEEKEEKEYPLFARDINALFSEKEADNENHFRISVIKADLDGMGAMFKSIQDYEVYKEVSEILNREISLDGLHDSITTSWPEASKGWLFPFYIAGDDIFFAVSVANLIKGIDVCRSILRRINDELKNAGLEIELSMSIGVEITFNREPIRYYMQMVERQLKNAKKSAEEDNREVAFKFSQRFIQMTISIGGLSYRYVDRKRLKEYKNGLSRQKKRNFNSALQAIPVWNFFLDDVYRLNNIRINASKYNELLGTPGFFYTLLERLSDKTVQEDNTKYINSVLYHLLPNYMNSSNNDLKKMELLLHAGILKQLLIKDDDGDNGMEIILNKQTKHRLENYLRLMLLFSDSRFQLTKNFAYKENKKFPKNEINNARKYLFTKSTDYLYQMVIEKGEALTNIFAVKKPYKFDKKGDPYCSCLQRLNIEKGMFLRLRDTEKVSVDKAANMIAMRNGNFDKVSIDKTPDMIALQKEEYKKNIENFNNERIKAGKAPYRLFFDEDAFRKQAYNNKEWNPDFVDSLMLLYAYTELAINFKKQFNN